MVEAEERYWAEQLAKTIMTKYVRCYQLIIAVMQSLQVGEDAIKAQTVDCVFVLILDTSMYKEDMYKSGGGGYRWW